MRCHPSLIAIASRRLPPRSWMHWAARVRPGNRRPADDLGERSLAARVEAAHDSEADAGMLGLYSELALAVNHMVSSQARSLPVSSSER